MSTSGPGSPTSPFGSAAKKRMTRTGSFKSVGPVSPGVGAYSVPSSFARAAAPGRMVGSKSAKKSPFLKKEAMQRPGPGSHEVKDPRRPTIGKSGSKISVGIRRESKSNNVPGPGEYNAHNPAKAAVGKDSKNKYSFGARISPTKKFATPGPGAHAVQDPRKPQIGKGGRKAHMAPRRKQSAPDIPGPGHYEPKKLSRTTSNMIGSKSKRGSKIQSITPGPGAHEVRDPRRPTIGSGGRKHTISTRRSVKPAAVPGPGAYEAPDAFKKARSPGRPVGSQSFSPKKQIAPGVLDKGVPGPGTHVISSKFGVGNSGKKYSMGARREDPNYYLPPRNR